MESQPVLLSVAALSLTLVGFASLTLAFQHRDFAEWPPELRIRLRTLVESGLVNMAFALLPLSLFYLGLTEPPLWHLASVLLGVAIVAVTVRVTRRSGPLIRSGTMGWLYPVLATGLMLVVALVNFLSPIVPLSMPAAAGIYLAGLMTVLVFASSIFLRLLTFPKMP